MRLFEFRFARRKEQLDEELHAHGAAGGRRGPNGGATQRMRVAMRFQK
jgi:hypothetical protein